MEHYVTLFDSLFLPQGLALHRSMERHLDAYTLWVLCMDEATHDALSTFGLNNVRLLKLSELETDALKAVKPVRTKGEYCWTLTPFAPKFVFAAAPEAERVTYLDADLWFRKKPSSIFAEFEASGKQVLITDHAYAAEFDQSATAGQYCVQFLTFTRHGGEAVRQWWEDRCLEWCFARAEDGKFGDQKYLDDWPERFYDKVHVLRDKELTLAPWNATRFPYGNAVVWHFHGLRLCVESRGNSIRAEFGPYPIPLNTRAQVYAPYLLDLAEVCRLMSASKIEVRTQVSHSLLRRLKSFLERLYLSWLWLGATLCRNTRRLM